MDIPRGPNEQSHSSTPTVTPGLAPNPASIQYSGGASISGITGPPGDATQEKTKRGVTTSRDVRLMVMGALVSGVPTGRIREVFQLSERQIRYIRDRGVDPQHHKSGRRKKPQTPPPESGPTFEGFTVGNSEVFTRPLTKNPHIVYDRLPPPPNAQIIASDPSAESPWRNTGPQEGSQSYARLLAEDPHAFIKAFQRDPMANARPRNRTLNNPPIYRPAPWDESMYINSQSGIPQVYNGQQTVNAQAYNGRPVENPQVCNGQTTGNHQTAPMVTGQPPETPVDSGHLATSSQTPQGVTRQPPASPHVYNGQPITDPQSPQAFMGQAPATPQVYRGHQLSGTPQNPQAFTGPPPGPPQAYPQHPPPASPQTPRRFITPGTGEFPQPPPTTPQMPQAFSMPVQGNPQHYNQLSTGVPSMGPQGQPLPAPEPQRPQVHVWIAGAVFGEEEEENSESSEEPSVHQLSDDDSDEELMEELGENEG